jgi:tRNA nucleotidyltransferase (CCA-adding enzyme)
MLKGRDPLASIHLIHDLELYHQIFYVLPSVVPTLSSEPADIQTSLAATDILFSIISPADFDRTGISLPPVHPLLHSSATGALPRLYLAAALTPYKGVTYADHKGKTFPATEAVLRDGLKLGVQNHYFDGIPALFTAAALLAAPDASQTRVKIGELLLTRRRTIALTRGRTGLLLREKSVHNPITGQSWALSLLFSLVQELAPLYGDLFDGSFMVPVQE